MEYLLHILIIINIYIIVGLSLNLIAGYSGLVSVSHAGFYGIGAYAAALLALNFHVNFIVGIAAGIVAATMIGFAIGYPSLRFRGDFFVIATLGFQMILFDVMNNWMGLTNGPLGLPGIPQPTIFGFQITSHISFFILTLFFAIAVYFVCRRLVNSPFGNVLRGMREDEVFALSLGKECESL